MAGNTVHPKRLLGGPREKHLLFFVSFLAGKILQFFGNNSFRNQSRAALVFPCIWSQEWQLCLFVNFIPAIFRTSYRAGQHAYAKHMRAFDPKFNTKH